MSNLAIFTPLMRQTVGFDRFNDLFEKLVSDTEERFESYPPYNIEKVSEDAYRITLAVAGFQDEHINIVAENDVLKITGRQGEETKENEGTYLHRGIAGRAFERTFRLADHIRVEDATLEHGLLSISLVREVPEEKKPRMIAINAPKTFLSKKK